MNRVLINITPPGIMGFLYLAAYSLVRLGIAPTCSITQPALGFSLIGLGVILMGWAVLQFLLHRTTIIPVGTPAHMIVGGPFRFSRNPIYLADLIITLGIALWLGSLVYWAVPVLLFPILNFCIIPEEEKKMRMVFGNEFGAYASRIRRWL